MSRITTGKDEIPKNSILARIFGLRQGFKDKSCPGQEIGETRTRYHPCAKILVNFVLSCPLGPMAVREVAREILFCTEKKVLALPTFLRIDGMAICLRFHLREK